MAIGLNYISFARPSDSLPWTWPCYIDNHLPNGNVPWSMATLNSQGVNKLAGGRRLKVMYIRFGFHIVELNGLNGL